MAMTDRVHDLIEPIVASESASLYDIDLNGGILRVLVDYEGGIDVDRIRRISRAISRLFDEVDPIPGRYTLEVSSPGLERPLRTPDHFIAAIGSGVKVKTSVEVEGRRRFIGTLASADDDGFELRDEVVVTNISYADVSSARTIFEWGPTPKSGGKAKSKSKKSSTSHREATS